MVFNFNYIWTGLHDLKDCRINMNKRKCSF